MIRASGESLPGARGAMPRKSIFVIKSGMKVAESVRNRNGMVLVQAGTALTDRHIQIMKSWGIQAVEVEGDGPPTSGEMRSAAEAAEIAQELDEMFEEVSGDAVMRAIKRVAIYQITRRQPATGRS